MSTQSSSVMGRGPFFEDLAPGQLIVADNKTITGDRQHLVQASYL